MEIRGNKGLFAYFRKFKSIITDENSGFIKNRYQYPQKIKTKNLSTINSITMHIL